MADGPELTDGERALLAAAATGHLEEAERGALEALLVREPRAAGELAALREVLAALEPLRVPGAGWWEVADPALQSRVAAATAGPPSPGPAPTGPGLDGPVLPGPVLPGPVLPAPRRGGRGRVAAYALAACALLVAGGVGGAVVRGVVDDRSEPAAVAGPPGTLGALEALSVQTASTGVTASAAVVAHTWGTETLLEVAGLPVGETYQVVVVDEQGRAVVAGTFLGSQVPVECVMNAAVLREDADRLEVLDPSGAVVVVSDLPPTA